MAVWLFSSMFGSGTKIFSIVFLKNFSGVLFLSRFQVIGTFKLSTVLKHKPETTVTKDNVLKNLLLVSVDCVRHKKFPCGLGGHNIEDPTLLL